MWCKLDLHFRKKTYGRHSRYCQISIRPASDLALLLSLLLMGLVGDGKGVVVTRVNVSVCLL